MVVIIFRETKAVPARWCSGNILYSYTGGPELKFRCRQIIYYTTIETQQCCRAYTPKILKARMTIDVKCFSITLENSALVKTKNVLSNLEWVFSTFFFIKMTKEHQISKFSPLKPPFHPFRGWVLKNSFLVVTYIVIGIYTPNFTFLAPVVSALRWSSVSQSVNQSVSPFIYGRYR